MKRSTTVLTFLVGTSLAMGCGDSLSSSKPSVSDKKGTDGKGDAYDPFTDNPATFANDLNHKLADLPMQGEATMIPWAGSYWPTYEDGINARWDGPDSESPAAKYGRAFGVENIEDKVSKEYGIDRYRGSRTACKESSECDSDKGESCAKRTGQEDGVCIPTWWGICHAWAPVSISVPEPKHPVTVNGVEFKVQDLKALLTLSWNRTHSRFVSSRCNKNENDLTRDAYGNYRQDPECENTNPGTWHIIATNYLGIRGEAFVYDRTYDDEVWNQPLRGYEITRQDEIDVVTANRMTGVVAEGGQTTNASATVAKDEFIHQPAIAVTPGETLSVTMTGTGDADLYVRFDAQPTASEYDCRPYDGGSNEKCGLQVPAGATQAFVSVLGYEETSDVELTIVAGGSVPTTYKHNDKAAKLYHVEMKVAYISEASSQTDGNLADNIDQYTHYDHYEYVLEVDAEGRIIGGVWVGDSITTHPDFLWLPTGAADATVAGGAISRAQIMALVEQSLADPNVDPNDGPDSPDASKTVSESGTVAKDQWKHYGPFVAADGVKATLSGTGDADLYVRKNAQPTSTAYDCRPYLGSSDESCAVTGPGAYYVSVNGYTASDFALEIEYREGNGGSGPSEDPVTEVSHIDASGSLAEGEAKQFTLRVNAGQRIVVRTLSSKDVDLYIQMNATPTTSAYLERAWTTSGNETISYVPTSNGTLHILVYGYEAADYVLRTSND